MPCIFWHLFALVVVIAVWVGADTTLFVKLILTAILLAIWGFGFLWPGLYIVLPFYTGAVYFLYFGSTPGKRWRP